jgi:hypothetical protein
MRRIINMTVLVVCVSGIAGATTPVSFLAVTPATEDSYLAILVPMPDGSEIEGLRWFNKEAGTIFQEAKLLLIDEDGFPSLAGAYTAASGLAGSDTSWTEIMFSQPITSEAGDLFLALRYPQDPENGDQSKKPGVGYSLTTSGQEAWVTADGVNWTRLYSGVTVYLEAICGASKGLNSIVMRAPEVPAFVTSLALPQPNPFNPSTTLKFTLAEAGKAEVVIYDTRGAAVKTLVSAELSAGLHDVVWHGSDDHGRPVASGLYFARLKCRTGSGVQRLMLIR